MARGDQLGRQWKILQMLTSSRRGLSVKNIAEEIDCHPRTVYRDLEALEIAGFPVYTDREEGRNLWAILDTAKQNFPIPLSLTELMALYFSRSLLGVLRGSVFYGAMETFFDKIKTTLPLEYREYLEKLHQSLRVGHEPYKPLDTHLESALNTVHQAIGDRTQIVIDYFSMGSKKQQKRTIEPYKVWFHKNSFYLIGYCQTRKDIRVFALDRIQSIDVTGIEFEAPDDLAVNGFMASSFGVFLGTPVTVKIRFDPDIAGYITEKIWHETQKTHLLKNGAIDFEVIVAGTEEIKHWVMGWGASAEVLEPVSLRDEIHSDAMEMAARYKEPEGLV